MRLIDGFTARRMTSAFHALTEAVATDATSALGVPRSQITVIGRGRDLSRLGEITSQRREDARAALALELDDVAVVSVGRQEYQKGHHVLVEAAALLRADASVYAWFWWDDQARRARG